MSIPRAMAAMAQMSTRKRKQISKENPPFNVVPQFHEMQHSFLVRTVLLLGMYP